VGRRAGARSVASGGAVARKTGHLTVALASALGAAHQLASANISLLLAARAAQYDTMMKLVIYLPRESDLTRYVVIQMNYCLRLDQKSDAGFGLTSNVP
jgi:uncharacterized protein YcnI